MFEIEGRSYTAALRWKKGEMDALRSLDDESKERLLPHVILPPLSVKDIEQRRLLSKQEFSTIQVGRLQQNWAHRPVLVDFRFLRFDKDAGVDAAWLSEFLTMARRFNCRIIPVVDPQTDAYRVSAIAAAIENSRSGGAIRVGLHDLQNVQLESLLETLLFGIRRTPDDCLLILDLGEADISNVEVFSQFTLSWLTKLRSFQPWKRIIVEASSYPTKNPAPRNGRVIAPRDEWRSWLEIVKDESLLAHTQFGDFGADHGHVDFDLGGRTVIHLRYTTPEGYLIERGGLPTFDHSGKSLHDGTIWTVAKRIAEDAGFFGENFSAGDEFVATCAGRAATGNSTTWRWANMVHHLTMVTGDCSRVLGTPFAHVRRAPVKQLSLLT